MPQLLLALALLLGGLRLLAGAASSTDVGSHWDPNGQPTADVGYAVAQLKGRLSGGEIAHPSGAGRPVAVRLGDS